ncbi:MULTISPECIES: hypothetical protein [Moorena]|nr:MULTISPECIES: hypothetical protein [Moorena]NER90413.1 hypothetical protein [Moorena sp. SIO3A2]
MGETPKTALHRWRLLYLDDCTNLCKVAKSPSAPCSLLPVPCSLFPTSARSLVNFTFL